MSSDNNAFTLRAMWPSVRIEIEELRVDSAGCIQLPNRIAPPLGLRELDVVNTRTLSEISQREVKNP